MIKQTDRTNKTQEIIRTQNGTNQIVRRKKYSKHNINKKTLAQAIIQNNGLISKIAKQMNAPVPTIKNMIKKDNNLQTIQDTTKDIIIDEAESQLYKKIKQGNFQAIKYFLDKQASSRGYNDQQEINVTHTGGIVIMPATVNNEQWEQSARQVENAKGEAEDIIDEEDAEEVIEAEVTVIDDIEDND